MTQTPQPDSSEKKAQVQDYFARTAESYVASFSHRTGDDLQRLIELGEWDPQHQVLDIATQTLNNFPLPQRALIASPVALLPTTFLTWHNP